MIIIEPGHKDAFVTVRVAPTAFRWGLFCSEYLGKQIGGQPASVVAVLLRQPDSK